MDDKSSSGNCRAWSQSPGFSGSGIFLTLLLVFVVPQCCSLAHPASFPSVWAPTEPSSAHPWLRATLSIKNPSPGFRQLMVSLCGGVRQQFLVSFILSCPLPLLLHAQTKLVLVRAGEVPEFQGCGGISVGFTGREGQENTKKLPLAGPELGIPLHTEVALSSRETSAISRAEKQNKLMHICIARGN